MLPKLVAIVDDVPKTSVGKFDKKTIKAEIEDYKAKAKDMRNER
jgi:acyl-CoA synthetase (AMP-forming)/AMP-acid ligase II